MPLDFRADRVQTKALIADRSSGAKLIIYPSDAKLDNNGGIDPAKLPPAQYEADDVFIFISGSIGGLGGVDNGVSVFGGDVYVSGSLAGETLIFNNLVGEQVMVNFVPILNVDQVLGQKVYFSQVGDIATYSGQVEYKSVAPGNSVLTINLSANGLVEVPAYTGEISGVSSTHYAEDALAMGTNSTALIYEESGDQYIYISSDSVGSDGIHSAGFTISFRNPMGSASGGGGGGGGGDASDWAMYPAVQNVGMDGKRITNMAEPVLPSDAATKKYIDDINSFSSTDGSLIAGIIEDAAGTNEISVIMYRDHPDLNAADKVSYVAVGQESGSPVAEIIVGADSANEYAGFRITQTDIRFGGKLTTDGVYTPVDPEDLATKKYVDENSGGGGGSAYHEWVPVWDSTHSETQNVTNATGGPSFYTHLGHAITYSIRATIEPTALGPTFAVFGPIPEGLSILDIFEGVAATQTGVAVDFTNAGMYDCTIALSVSASNTYITVQFDAQSTDVHVIGGNITFKTENPGSGGGGGGGGTPSKIESASGEAFVESADDFAGAGSRASIMGALYDGTSAHMATFSGPGYNHAFVSVGPMDGAGDSAGFVAAYDTTSDAYLLQAFGAPLHVEEPTESSHAATKGYVDSQLGGGGTPSKIESPSGDAVVETEDDPIDGAPSSTMAAKTNGADARVFTYAGLDWSFAIISAGPDDNFLNNTGFSVAYYGASDEYTLGAYGAPLEIEEPVESFHAATKAYVDSQSGGGGHAFLEFTEAYPDPGSSINSYWLKWTVDYDPENLIEQSPTYDYAFRIREPGYYLLHFNLAVDSSAAPTDPMLMFRLQNTNTAVSNATSVHGVMSYDNSAFNIWKTIFTGTSRHVYQTTTAQFRGISIRGLAKGAISSIYGNVTIQKIGRWGA